MIVPYVVTFLVGISLSAVVCVFRYKGAAILAWRDGFEEGEKCGFNAAHLQAAGRIPRTSDFYDCVETITVEALNWPSEKYVPWSVLRQREADRDELDYAENYGEAHARHDIH